MLRVTVVSNRRHTGGDLSLPSLYIKGGTHLCGMSMCVWESIKSIESALPPRSGSQRIDQRLERGRLVATARVVEEIAVKRRTPILEDPHELAA